MLRPDVVAHLFGRPVAEAGVERIRLHDLRHVHATSALAAGVDIEVVSARLGHSTTHITSNLYMHVVPEVAREAADAIAAAVAYARRARATGVAVAWPQEVDHGEARSPPRGEAAGQTPCGPPGARTLNPRIKRAGRGVQRGPGRAADLRRWCAGVRGERGGCRRVALTVAVNVTDHRRGLTAGANHASSRDA
ncbi:tyrosine-type recombinase/integrase [Kineococcus arenarius]|uniref:tyrosine-type recombinase/integrase n=1 Tax=Kineococcus sp. SYSU DK007 TaxID=3383128 RepID=UPI003D7CC014